MLTSGTEREAERREAPRNLSALRLWRDPEGERRRIGAALVGFARMGVSLTKTVIRMHGRCTALCSAIPWVVHSQHPAHGLHLTHGLHAAHVACLARVPRSVHPTRRTHGAEERN